MAFSFRKMFSNIVFRRPGEDDSTNPEVFNDAGAKKRRHSSFTEPGEGVGQGQNNFERIEMDLSVRRFANFVKRNPEPVKYFSAKTSSLSDTDLLKIEHDMSKQSKKGRRRAKKLRLDIDKANRSAGDGLDETGDNKYANCLIENTPEQISLGMKTAGVWSEGSKIRAFNFDQSFDLFDHISDDEPSSDSSENQLDVESLSESSDSEVTVESDEKDKSIEEPVVKMCRKVTDVNGKQALNFTEKRIIRPPSTDSFTDVESDRNEDERISLLLSYQMKLEKMERFLKRLLTEFQFHIEVSKIFHCKSILTTLPGSDVTNLPRILGEITHMDNIPRGASPSGSWNIVMEKEDTLTKLKLRKQLLSMKHFIEEFIDVHLQTQNARSQYEFADTQNSITQNDKSYDNVEYCRPVQEKPIKVQKENKAAPHKKLRINRRKRERRIEEFPDLKEILHNLFSLDAEKTLHQTINTSVSGNNVTALISDLDPSETSRCTCNCLYHARNSTISSQIDSGLPTNTDDKTSSNTIASSIGDFTLDSSTLTAYSESLDNVLSYNSYNDSSLVSSILQKSAIERITFYIQVHNVQMRSNLINENESFEPRSNLTFSCQACGCHEISDEYTLIRHILSQRHCEKVHFLYKTAYIKKCLASNTEIQPSTILNPMTMYRDANKIVCFGDSKFACSLCLENSIVGESVLIAHCSQGDHAERRKRLDELLE